MTADGAYRLLLRVYPRQFRSEYGREMTLIFREEYRTRETIPLVFWVGMLRDVARSATSMWADVWVVRVKQLIRTLEVMMKLTGILAVLFGVFEALNVLAELVLAMRDTLGGAHFVAIVLGFVAAALLIAAGTALLRGPVSGRHAATIALASSLATILVARVTHPWMSILSQLVGIGLPLVLLAAMHWPRRPHSSSPAAS